MDFEITLDEKIVNNFVNLCINVLNFMDNFIMSNVCLAFTWFVTALLAAFGSAPLMDVQGV